MARLLEVKKKGKRLRSHSLKVIYIANKSYPCDHCLSQGEFLRYGLIVIIIDLFSRNYL